MKKFLALFLVAVLVMTGCSPSHGESTLSSSSTTVQLENEQTSTEPSETTDINESEIPENQDSGENGLEDIIIEADSKVPWPEPTFLGLNDPNLLPYVEQTIYADLSNQLDANYQIQNVSSMYISKEYLEEVAYNSQSNVFFGYSLADLDAEFQGTRYVFTLGENGETTVVPLEEYDDTYEKVLKNVAIGTGVILVCVTVSVVTGGAGAPAVSMIFAASAKTGAIFAASSGALSAVMAGTVTGLQTHDFDAALKAGALAGSESFKWGAISGAILGGASELITLQTAAKGGLTLDEAAVIIKENNLPANFVKQIKSMDEYQELLSIAEKTGISINEMSQICMNTGYPIEIVKLFRKAEEGAIYFDQAGLVYQTVNGQAALIRTIDLTYQSELAGKTVTNLDRMRQGYAAIDPATGQAFELHHIGQSIDSPLAILSKFEHMGGGNNTILHDPSIEQGVHSLISNSEWAAQTSAFWKALATMLAG